MTSQITDEQARHLIENDTSTNFFVEAGAGSGKTTELVARMLAMVEQGVDGHEIDVSEICAITFTKAAANEFKDRFQVALKESGSPQAKRALENIDLCFMGTIDSFCNMILSEHPVEACIPASSSVVDEQDIEQLWLSSLSGIAKGDFGEELKAKYELFTKYVKNFKDYFIECMKFLSAVKNTHLNYETFPGGVPFTKIFEKQIADICAAVKFCVDHKDEFMYSSTNDKLAYSKIDVVYKAVNSNWEDLDYILYLLSVLTKLRFDKSVDISEFRDIPMFFMNMFSRNVTDRGQETYWKIDLQKDGGNPFYFNDFDNFIYFTMMDFTTHAYDAISNLMQKSGHLTFADYLFCLKEMLKKDAANGGKLIEYIHNKHKYFLIDEFQDTDPVQSEIFFLLSASNLDSTSTWQECIPYPGSLFIVGDPKQSIYRFRNADVASYLNVKKLFENPSVGKILPLKKNFRSSGPMCDWFNKTFEKLLVSRPGIQSGFEPIPIDEKPEYKGTLNGVYKNTYLATHFKDAPAGQNLVAIISSIVNNDKYTIQDTKMKNGVVPALRTINYGDIMVISYGKKKLKIYMDAMRKANIPFVIEGNVLFDDCPALKTLWCYFSLVTDPENVKAKKSVEFLTADGISDEDLTCFNKLSKNLNSSTLCYKLIDSLHIIEQMGTKNIEYLFYALELLKSAEQDGQVLNHVFAVQFLKNLITNNSDKERCLQLAKDKNCVHIANLHKVKGLQAPVVIMTEARQNSKNPSKHVDYNLAEPQSYLFSVDKNFKTVRTHAYTDKQQIEQDILDAEKMRLMYVAATRAECVFIATDFKTSKNKESASNISSRMIDCIERELDLGLAVDEFGALSFDLNGLKSSRIVCGDRQVAEKLHDDSAAQYCVNENAASATYSINRPSKEEVKKDTSLTEDDVVLRPSNDNLATLKGSLVHRYMELLVNARCFDGFNHDLACIAAADFPYDGALDVLKSSHYYVAGLFNALRSAEEIYTEAPFTYTLEDGSICDGVIDLLYKDADGWHIVDYKTNKDGSNLNEKYASQLASYQDALSQLCNISTTATTLWIGDGGCGTFFKLGGRL